MTEQRIREPDFVYRVHIPRVISNAVAGLHWALLRARPSRFRLRVLFVLSHQRSGSSLLVHCLNTNTRVLGYGETLIHYTSERDFWRLPLMIMARTRKLVVLQRYVVDKLLYDELIAEPRLLQSENIRVIFLLREPSGALQSLIHAPNLDGWAQRPEANRNYVDQENAARYYCNRLGTLEEYARTIGDKERSMFITYDQLLERTSEVFGAWKQLLGVDGSFSEKYEILRTTGISGYGDVSANIGKGQLARDVRHPRVAVRQDLLGSATQAFEHCCSTLRRHCSALPSSPDKKTTGASRDGMTS